MSRFRFNNNCEDDLKLIMSQYVCKVSCKVDSSGNRLEFSRPYNCVSDPIAHTALAPPSAPTNLAVDGDVGDNPVLDWDDNYRESVKGLEEVM